MTTTQPACFGAYDTCTTTGCKHNVVCCQAMIGHAKKAEKRENLARRFEQDLAAAGITGYVKEYKFDSSRDWRFDYAWPEQRVAVELQGGVYTGKKSGHTSMFGVLRDCEKLNAATLQGWRVFLFPGQFVTGATLSRTTTAMGCELRACKRCDLRRGRGCSHGRTPERQEYREQVSIEPCAVAVVRAALKGDKDHAITNTPSGDMAAEAQESAR